MSELRLITLLRDGRAIFREPAAMDAASLARHAERLRTKMGAEEYCIEAADRPGPWNANPLALPTPPDGTDAADLVGRTGAKLVCAVDGAGVVRLAAQRGDAAPLNHREAPWVELRLGRFRDSSSGVIALAVLLRLEATLLAAWLDPHASSAVAKLGESSSVPLTLMAMRGAASVTIETLAVNNPHSVRAREAAHAAASGHRWSHLEFRTAAQRAIAANGGTLGLWVALA